MAVQETRTLPAPFIESIGKDYAKGLTDLTSKPIATQQFAPTVVDQDQLQLDAAALAGTGLGAYQPYLTGQGAFAGTPTDMIGCSRVMAQLRQRLQEQEQEQEQDQLLLTCLLINNQL